MPAQPTVMEWALKDPVFADQYGRARELQLQAWEDEIVDISDNQARGADTNRDKLKIDTRKWIMSKRLPKKYGDRVALAGDPETPLNAPITDQDAARQIALLMAQAATRKMKAKKK